MARSRYQLIVVAFAATIFLGCIFRPPSLMDDMDSVQAQISRNMIRSGDWVTPHVDGVPYFEKAPLKYWLIAASFLVFGVHDWAARLPLALAAMLLCWMVARIGEWNFGEEAGLYAGLSLATCIGLFLFTRVLIPDCMLAVAITATMFALMRSLDEERPGLWPLLFWGSMAAGVLLKGLIGLFFPAAATAIYLAARRQLFRRETWSRLKPLSGIILFLVLALPWHVLAAIRNPPLLDFTTHSESGSYHGFFWFYFINEQVLRFLGRRYPRDYDTVPRFYFWILHMVWLFPWSLYFPVVVKLDYRSGTRASRTRLLCLIWIAVVLVFFSLSTSQEYYSLPCYPPLALLLGSALASNERLRYVCTRAAAAIAGVALASVAALLYIVRNTPAPGDISAALAPHPEAYTLSLGHMGDLTLQAFAYLRLPLAVAAVAFLIGTVGAMRGSIRRGVFCLAMMMVMFFHAARLALTVFDPYLSSRPLAEALARNPEGTLIVDDPYWEFSSVFFYSNKTGLLLNGRRNNLEYGSYAPGAANVFIGDPEFVRLWTGAERCYVVVEGGDVERLRDLVGENNLNMVTTSGGKYLFSNH